VSASPLLLALVPHRAETRERFGIATAVVVAALKKAGTLAAGKGLQWVQTPEGKEHLSKLKERVKVTEASERKRLDFLEHKARTAKGEDAKARWASRAKALRRKLDDAQLDVQLAEQGIVGEGPVLEAKRNLLAAEWEDADDARKAEVEAEVADLDKRIAEVARRAKALATAAVAPAAPAATAAPAKTGSAQRRRRKPSELEEVDRKLLNGMGGLRFTALAPPGPGRLCRLPFYPVDDADAWSGATGIDEPGDDPILRLTIPATLFTSGPVLMETPVLDWATYRLVGLQTVDDGVYIGSAAAAGTAAPGITLSNLSVYNSRSLFLQEAQVPAWTYSVMPGDMTVAPSGTIGVFEPVTHYLRRKSRFFSGLRDYPVVNDTASVRITVRAFTGPAAAEGADGLAIPFSCNLVVEILEDKLIGDPVNPGPYARAGALIKAGTREMGLTTGILGGPPREVFQITSSRYRRE
jgi:hypothetical protein